MRDQAISLQQAAKNDHVSFAERLAKARSDQPNKPSTVKSNPIKNGEHAWWNDEESEGWRPPAKWCEILGRSECLASLVIILSPSGGSQAVVEQTRPDLLTPPPKKNNLALSGGPSSFCSIPQPAASRRAQAMWYSDLVGLQILYSPLGVQSAELAILCIPQIPPSSR
jgi:hypothetical protein